MVAFFSLMSCLHNYLWGSYDVIYVYVLSASSPLFLWERVCIFSSTLMHFLSYVYTLQVHLIPRLQRAAWFATETAVWERAWCSTCRSLKAPQQEWLSCLQLCKPPLSIRISTMFMEVFLKVPWSSCHAKQLQISVKFSGHNGHENIMKVVQTARAQLLPLCCRHWSAAV